MQELNLIGILSTGGRLPVIEPKNITANGTYTAPEGVDGYSPVTVNVPSTQPVIEPKNITANGTYTAPEGVDGYSPVTVNVPSTQPVIEPKNITANGTYTAPEGVDGYSPVTVNVPQNCNMYSSNNDQLRLYENVFNGIDILTFNGLYINQTMAFNDIDNVVIKNKLLNLTFNPIASVFNSISQNTSNNQIGIDPSAQIIIYYINNLSTHYAGNVYGSLILINCDIIANQYPIQNNPNIGG